MYVRDIIRSPQKITRNEFVNIIFDIGLNYNYGYDTLIASVQLGDQYIDQDYNNDYTKELAYVCLILTTKLNEDDYYSTAEAVDELENKYVLVLEWEIFRTCKIKIKNFMTYLGYLTNHEIIFGPIFWDLCKDICINKTLLQMNPQTILLGCFLLNDKLKCIKQYQQRYFLDVIQKLSYNYEVDMSDILKKYIENKNDMNIIK